MFDLPSAERIGAAERIFWAAAIFAGAVLGFAYLGRLFQTDAHGVSLFVGKPPVLDFINVWYGGKLALDGRAEELFNVPAFRAGLEQMFNSPLQPCEWSYPPTLLLIAAPLAFFPLYLSYSMWTFGTLGALSFAVRRAGVPPIGLALLWFSPAVLNNMFFGQNGAATAALLIGGLLLAEKRAWLAGLCFALLAMKPHLGVLVPVCLIAAANWKAIGWSAAFTAIFVMASALIFGPDLWRGFWNLGQQPFMHVVLEAPYGNGFQMNASSLFLTARWLGSTLAVASLVQLSATIACLTIAWRIWRKARPLEEKVALTAILTPLSTPYVFSYDLVMVAAGALILAYRSRLRLELLPLWILPVLVAPLNRYVGHVAPLIILLCFIRAAAGDAHPLSVLQRPKRGVQPQSVTSSVAG